MPGSDHVQSVARAMQLLDCLAKARRPLTLRDISQRTGLAKSTVHGILATMRANSVIEQSEDDGRYRLGIRLFEWGSLVSGSWDIIGIARSHLQDIAFRTGASASLSALSRGSVIIIDQVEPSSAFHVVSEVGSGVPLHSTSQGKLHLSFVSAVERRRLLAEHGMMAFTPHTVVTLEAMDQECEKIRRDGFSVEDGEHHIGLRSVSAPIFDISGNVPYAITVVGMFRRTSSDEFRAAERMVVDAAGEISRQLGYRQK